MCRSPVWDDLGYYAGYYVTIMWPKEPCLATTFHERNDSPVLPFRLSNKHDSSFTSDTYHTNILVFAIEVLQFSKTNLKWATWYVFGPDESGIIVLTCFQVLRSHKDYWGLSEISLMKKRVNLSKLECSENNNNNKNNLKQIELRRVFYAHCPH